MVNAAIVDCASESLDGGASTQSKCMRKVIEAPARAAKVGAGSRGIRRNPGRPGGPRIPFLAPGARRVLEIHLSRHRYGQRGRWLEATPQRAGDPRSTPWANRSVRPSCNSNTGARRCGVVRTPDVEATRRHELDVHVGRLWQNPPRLWTVTMERRLSHPLRPNYQLARDTTTARLIIDD